MRPPLWFAALAAIATLGAQHVVIAADVGQDATVARVHPPTAMAVYPTLDADLAPSTDATWRVVRETGNCCENYYAATAAGTLVNFGGSFPYVTNDNGKTWSRVMPRTPVINAEGAVSGAPNGDIVGVIWDPYGGDRITTYKFDATTGRWRWTQQLLHTPFWDRPWLSIAPGPFTIGVATYPYATIIEGGVGVRRPLLISFDGTSYVGASEETLALIGSKGAVIGTATPSPDADWTQPNANGTITPAEGGGAFSRASECGELAHLDADLTWSCVRFAGEHILPIEGTIVSDSRGGLHSAQRLGDGIAYNYSPDGGSTWDSRFFALPDDLSALDIDLKANAALGMSVMAIHATHVHAENSTDQDLVYRFSLTADGPMATRIYFVGKGDASFGGDITSSGPRFDFCSVAILADGAIATSFADSDHPTPATAILVN